MILEQTEETLSDRRFTSQEEMTAKYSRIISGAFYILSHLIGK